MARILAILLLVGAGCTEPRGKTCSEVCSREAACHEQLSSDENFDEGECLDACAALERDTEAKKQVERHAECVKEKQTCEEVLSCP